MKYCLYLGLTLITIFFFPSCQKDKPGSASASTDAEPTLTADNPLLRLRTAAETGIDFQNRIDETLDNNLISNPNIYNGGGVAVADVNNDGLPDLYFIASTGKNRLYLNQGNFKFKDVSEQARLTSPDGFKTGVTAADVNADGFIDFYVCRAGHQLPPEARRNRLYINNGNLTFTESAARLGLADPSLSVGANFFDYDLDGDLDLYLLNTITSNAYISKIEVNQDPATGVSRPVLLPKDTLDTDRLYRNDGNGVFTDVSKAAGIWNFGYGQSATVSDFNADGYPDIYVGNDYIQPDLLYINNRNGAFTDQLARAFQHTSQHTMGADLADFDNDGFIDLVALDMLPAKHARQKSTTNVNSQSRYKTLTQYGYFEPVVRNVLQRNNGDGTFSDVGCLAGVYKTDWSWGCLFFDIDNDGQKDLTITNGFRREVTDADFINFTYPELVKASKGKPFGSVGDLVKHIPVYKVRNVVYRNLGDWSFEEMSGKWLTMPASWSNGTVYADLDADGDLDWVVNNLEEPPFLYENLSAGKPGANYLQLKLQGEGKNPLAVGASATIHTPDGKLQYQELNPTRGIFSSSEHLIHFGLGNAGQVAKLVVRWPGGKTTTLTNVTANQRLTLRQAEANGREPLRPAAPPALFRPAATTIQFRHAENTYDDFDANFLQPWRLSDLGPALAKADVDGDGLDDFFIGNAFNQAPALFRQLPNGGFTQLSAALWETEKVYEDHGALFFDADSDGDPDLFVVSGGLEGANPAAWQHRLYLNDGKGNFSKSPHPLPALPDVGMRVAAHDYDGDGDQDLFVGGRATPKQYPLIPRSSVLRNEGGGRFSDATAEVAGDFERAGMIADLTWANVDADPAPELVAVGEWTPILIFKLQGGKLKNVSSALGLEKSDGLWNCVKAADLDGDGDTDLVSGNFGLNSSLTASAREPLRLFGKDFDGNGSIEPIMAFYEDSRLLPFRQRDAMIKQLPGLKKNVNQYKDYGSALLTDLFPENDLKAALNLYAYTLATTWWENQGGKFVAHPLPTPAQVAPVQGIALDDFNGDGKTDLFLVGNRYGVEVEIGRCDAGTGCLLINTPTGFSWLPNPQSGLWARREARDAAVLRGKNRTTVVVANNNSGVEVFVR